MGAAICRRGHVETWYIRPYEQSDRPADMCPRCGARVLTACPACGLRIRGDYFVPGVLGGATPDRSSFCDGCGTAFPWATREERIYELENLLDDEPDIDEADRAVISEHLRQLQNAAISERDERAAWSAIKQRAGTAIASAPVQRIVEGLVSAALRHQLGI
jgi:hypothetical protein